MCYLHAKSKALLCIAGFYQYVASYIVVLLDLSIAYLLLCTSILYYICLVCLICESDAVAY